MFPVKKPSPPKTNQISYETPFDKSIDDLTKAKIYWESISNNTKTPEIIREFKRHLKYVAEALEATETARTIWIEKNQKSFSKGIKGLDTTLSSKTVDRLQDTSRSVLTSVHHPVEALKPLIPHPPRESAQTARSTMRQESLVNRAEKSVQDTLRARVIPSFDPLETQIRGDLKRRLRDEDRALEKVHVITISAKTSPRFFNKNREHSLSSTVNSPSSPRVLLSDTSYFSLPVLKASQASN